MSASAKGVNKKATLLKPAVVINTPADFDKFSREFAIAERTRVTLEAEMTREIEQIKARYRARLEKAGETKKNLSSVLVEYARSVWNSSSVQSIFSYVVIKWSIPRGSLVIADEQATVATLENMGRTDLIRVVKEVKKNEFKAAFADDEKLMGVLGASIDKPEATGTPEVNWQTLATLDTEQRLAKTA